MDIGKKFISVTAGVFLLGLAAGVICGIGIGGTSQGPETQNAELPVRTWDLNGIKDTALYPNFPVALWDGDSQKYRSSQAIEELYGAWTEKGPFMLSELKSPFALVVFESPLCPFCFAMHGYLREIRKDFSRSELEIIIINTPALSEDGAKKAVSGIRKYLAASGEDARRAYISKDRNDFMFVSMSPKDNAETVKLLGIGEIPAMMLVNRDLEILYASEGYPVTDSGQRRSFFAVWDSLFLSVKNKIGYTEGAK